MENNQKIMLAVGLAATAGLIGWAIYASTKDAVEGGEESSKEGESEDPKTKVEQMGGGTIKVTRPDGKVLVLTPAQQKEEAKKATSGRGADGSKSWSNATGYIC